MNKTVDQIFENNNNTWKGEPLSKDLYGCVCRPGACIGLFRLYEAIKLIFKEYCSSFRSKPSWTKSDYQQTDIAAGYMTCSCSDETMIQVQVKVKSIDQASQVVYWPFQ